MPAPSALPAPTSVYHSPIVVVGGGIAGLWTLHALRQAGYGAILLEQTALGNGQTLAAQGILHGGMKYALDGKVDDIALKLRSMPSRWLESMAGNGEADLRSVRVLSPHQYLFSDGSLLSKAAALVGSKLMSGEATQVATGDLPPLLRGCQPVRLLHETILDTKSAVQALASPHQAAIFHAPRVEWQTRGETLLSAHVTQPDGQTLRLTADRWVFTAGVGNEVPAGLLPFPAPTTQRRPLRQVLLRGAPAELFGHCVAADPKPRFTITSHQLPSGEWVWYLGGNVAEKGALTSPAEAIKYAQKELKAVFPDFDWKSPAFSYATWSGDRAEPHQSSRFMPAEPTVQRLGNTLLAWPTKLVFAPGLASKVLAAIDESGCQPGDSSPVLPLPTAPVGEFPWESAEWV
jgi:glycine/D-amino acid oxidase-like deaminating enzyme